MRVSCSSHLSSCLLFVSSYLSYIICSCTGIQAAIWGSVCLSLETYFVCSIKLLGLFFFFLNTSFMGDDGILPSIKKDM